MSSKCPIHWNEPKVIISFESGLLDFLNGFYEIIRHGLHTSLPKSVCFLMLQDHEHVECASSFKYDIKRVIGYGFVQL